MSMKMGWRWYGEGNDPITLSDIKQIPGVEAVSYTHLDVYKRQTPTWPPRWLPLRR